jgi:hypothetical protein
MEPWISANELNTIELEQPALVDLIRFLARENLRLFMCELSRKYLEDEWAKDLEYKIWLALETGPRKLTEKDIEKLDRLYSITKGWWIKPLDEMIFLEHKEWIKAYKEWKSEQKKAQGT